MTAQVAHLSDEEFFYAYLPEYLDGQLGDAENKRFEGIAKENKWENIESDYGIAKGHLQLGIQKLFVNEELNHKLHVLVENDAERANHEAEDIDELGHMEVFGGVLRGVVFASVIALLVGLSYYYLGPKRTAAFAALDSLVYESVVMIEDPEGRLDFPTEDIVELRDYFNRYPDLNFRVDKFNIPGSNWQLEGGTVIDYEVQKIAAAQFASGDDKLFYYLFEGGLDDFPQAEPGSFKGVLYQTYTSEYFNILVWEINEDVVGMVIGTGTAETLAQTALNSFGTGASNL